MVKRQISGMAMKTDFYQYDRADAEIVNICINCNQIELLIYLDVTENPGTPENTVFTVHMGDKRCLHGAEISTRLFL